MAPFGRFDASAGAVSPASLRRIVVLSCVGFVLARAMYVTHPLRHDEAGYLFIARRWHTGGDFLYGDYFVDRPPLLMAIFKVAAITEWDGAVRLLAMGVAVGFVLAAWHAGASLSGRAGGRWAAAVAAGLMCSPALAADQADAELFGAALVMTGAALALRTGTATARRAWFAGVAGVCVGAAPLVKQNLVDGLAFLAVLVTAAAVGRGPGRHAYRTAGAALAGALLPYALLWLWVGASDVDAARAWRELVLFREAALDVAWSTRPQASLDRLGRLLALGLVSGLLPLVTVWLVAGRGRLELRRPERWAITALLISGVLAVLAGGSYWPNYLLQLAPAAVLVAGALAPSTSSFGSWVRGCGRVILTSAAVGTLVVGVAYAAVPRVSEPQLLGEWLGDSKEPSDTAFVAYGNAAVLEAADVSSPYPHLWSLPMRTLDPDQRQLRATLTGPEAPTWILQVNSLNSWGIDDGSRLRRLVRDRYRVVAEICGRPVWLRTDLRRRLAPVQGC